MSAESPAADALLERLEHFSCSMREFLSVLESSSPEDDRVVTAWARCTEAYQVLGDPAELLEGVALDERARVEDELEQALRLNAVLTAAVRRERDHLVQVLGQTSGARRAFSYYRAAEETGGTCDLAG